MIKIGMIGFGQRGTMLLRDVVIPREDVEVVAVCDLYEDRAEAAKSMIAEAKGKAPACFQDYKKILGIPEIEAVVITSAWESHIPIAIEAMKAGKYVGMEVGGAYSLEDCFELVRTYEQTGVHCMLLENCCYGKYELMVTNMVRKGLFGDIVHCSGSYAHDLREEITFGEEIRHYRLRNYLNRNCENYPTHELGPIAKLLNIHNGNRMVSLVSVSSASMGLHEYIKNNDKANKELLNKTFNQGDVVTTLIKCANGQTIRLTLDTTLPRSYSRGFEVRGTKAMYNEDNKLVFIDGVHNKYDFDCHEIWGNADEYLKEHQHPIWDEYIKSGVRGGHDGMDYLVFDAFFESVKAGKKPPIDVYDCAAWMAITPLSEESIAKGSACVTIPDFTHGKWIEHKEKTDKYDI